MNKWLLVSLLAVGLGVSGCSSISASYYGSQACSAEPNPNTWIGETVEIPISIYWEDDLYRGFSDADAALMVKNYLDGVHLKTMALNTPDGKVKIYAYKNLPQTYVDLVKEGFLVDQEVKKQKILFDEARSPEDYKDYPDNFDQISKAYFKVKNKKSLIQKEIEKAKSKLTLNITKTTKEVMPTMNYTVTTKVIPLSESAREYIYSDEVKVTDNRKKKVIAYNRRVMQLYSSSLLPDMVGGRRFFPDSLCGNASPERFDEDIFQVIGRSGKIFPGKHIKLKR